MYIRKTVTSNNTQKDVNKMKVGNTFFCVEFTEKKEKTVSFVRKEWFKEPVDNDKYSVHFPQDYNAFKSKRTNKNTIEKWDEHVCKLLCYGHGE